MKKKHTLRIIVQTDDGLLKEEDLKIQALGGEVTKKLEIVGSYCANLPLDKNS